MFPFYPHKRIGKSFDVQVIASSLGNLQNIQFFLEGNERLISRLMNVRVLNTGYCASMSYKKNETLNAYISMVSLYNKKTS